MMAKEDLETILNIENPYHLIAFVAVGKASKDLQSKPKKSLDEIFLLIE